MVRWKHSIRAGIGIFLPLALVAAACGDDADQGATDAEDEQFDRITLLSPFNFGPDKAPYFAAEAQGYFEDERLEVDIQEGTGSITIFQLMAANPNDTDVVGVGELQAALSTISQGAPLKSVMNVGQVNLSGITSRAETDINEPSDLEGKSIAITPGGTEAVVLEAVFRAQNIDPNSVDLVTVEGPAKDRSLEDEQVDAITTYITSFPIYLESIGIPTNTFTMADLEVPLVGDGIIVTQAMIDEKPDVIERLLRAIARGHEFAKENPEETIEAQIEALPDAGIEAETNVEGLKVALPLTESDATAEFGFGYHDPEVLDEMLDFMEAHEEFGLSERLDLDQYATNDFLSEAE